MAKLSIELERFFFEDERCESVTLEEILDIAGERIFGFLLIILALPSALPVPAPGYSIPFGVLLFILGLQLILGYHIPWLPRRMAKHPIKLELAQKFIKSGIPWLKRIEAVARPRLTSICTTSPGKILIGVVICLMSISMMIPIPGTNTVPAMGIFVTGFGLQEDDGAIALAGLLLSAIGGALSISIVITVVWGGTSLYDQLKMWLGR